MLTVRNLSCRAESTPDMMQARTLLLLGSALIALAPATEGFSAPSAGLARDLARGRMELRPAVRRNSPSCGIRMQAQAEPPQDPG